MFRRICAGVLVAALLLGGGVFSVSAAEPDTETGYRMKPLQDKLAAMTAEDVEGYLAKFSDMGKHWGRVVVGKLTGLEIISGYNGKFLPDNPVKVDEYITMVVKSLGFKPGGTSKYWAQPYIDTALKYKLITPGEFKDYRVRITREEAARIIVKATLLKEPAPNSDMDNLVRSKIADYPKIKDSNKQFVLQAYELGIMSGAGGGKFLPANTLTRAEATSVIIRNIDAASRSPFKPAEGDVFVITNPDGSVHTVYPPPKFEVLDAARAFESAYPKSKGYVWYGYSEDIRRIMYIFYSEQEGQDLEGNRMQMAVDLDALNDANAMGHPYYIIVYNAAAVKKLHRDSIYKMFKFWFEKDEDKAMAAFDRYLDYAVNNDQKNRVEEITYNGRLMFFYKVGGDDRFSLTINSLS